MSNLSHKITAFTVAVSSSLGVWATPTTSRTISINLQSAKVADAALSGDTEYGIEPVPAVGWTNDGCSYANNNANKDEDIDVSIVQYDNGTVTELTDVVLHKKVKNAYYWTNATDPFLKAYDDDSAQPIITVRNVPYARYTVIVYCATDSESRQFGPVTVNGTPYKYDADLQKAVVTTGSTSTEETRWGQSRQLTAVEGKNAIRITGMAGSTLTVMGGTNAGNARGGLAALQIVEESAVVVDVNGGEAYSTASFPENADVINLTMAADGVVTVSGELTQNVNLISSGAVSIVSGSGYTFTAADIAKINAGDVAGGTTLVFDAAAIPEGFGAPAAGITYRLTGNVTELPYLATAIAGAVSMDRTTIAQDGQLLAVGNKSYVFGEQTSITAGYFTLGNQGGVTQTFVQNGGTVTATSDNIGNTTSAAFLLAHWDCTVNYTLNGGTISVPNGGLRLGWDGAGTLTVNGGEVAAKGLRSHRDGHGGAGTLNLNGGTLTLGANGIDFGMNGNLNLNGGSIAVSDDATFTLDAGLEMAVDTTFTVPADKTLTLNTVLSGSGNLLKTGAGTLALEKLPQNFTGSICINAGAFDARGNRTLQNIVFAEGTKLIARETTADDGVIYITGITGNQTVELYDALGNAIAAENIERGDGYVKATFTPNVSGKGCWMDYEFDGDLTSVGTDASSLSRDGSDFGSDALVDFKTDGAGDAYALYAGTHPYRSVTYPTEWSCAISCSMPDYDKAALITFGTVNGGLIGLISGTAKDQVLLVRTTGNSAYEVLATMAVPNAATAQHLYVFTKTAREVKVYLDGKLWTTYNATSDITFGGGMQIASVHGGVGSTGIVRFDKNLFSGDTTNATLRKCVIGMMRLYNAVLGPNAAAALSREFPYVSPNGLFTREVATNGAWSQLDSWTKVQESGNTLATVPEDGAMVRISASAEATLDVNLSANVTTEELVIEGSGPITFAKSQAGKISNSGATTINAAVTIANQALDLAGGPLTLGANGSLTFDLTGYPFNTVLAATTIALTGMTDNQDNKVSAVLPESFPMGRTAEFAYDAASQTYQLKIGFTREAGEVYLASDVAGSLTINNSTTYVDAEGNDTVLFSDDDWIVIDRELEVTIGEDLTHPAKIKVVKGGVLKLNFAEGVTQSSDFKYNATVRIEDGGLYDLANANGHKDYSHPIILAGGTLTNTGIATTVDARQYWQNTVESTSAIEVSGNEFGAVNGGWAAHDYALNGNTLIKTGVGQYTFRTANFTGGGTLQVDEGTLILHACTVPEGATLNFAVAAGATIIVRGNALAKTGTVTGAGTVVYENGINTSAIYQDEGWNGTLWIKSLNWNNWDLGACGNGSSLVKLTGFSGYAPNSTGAGCNAMVEFADEGETKAVTVNNGYSSGVFFFKKVIGSGTFTVTSANTSKHVYQFKDVADFTGMLDAGTTIRIVIGDGTADNDHGSIVFADGVTINGGLDWTGTKAVFGPTLRVKGSRGDVLATVTNEPTFGKVKVTMLDEDGQPISGEYLLKTRAVEDGFQVYIEMTGFSVHLR